MVEYTFFGEEARFHHIGLAVKSIQAVSLPSDVVTEESQRVAAAFVRISGITIELLEPLGDASPIARSLREGAKLLHICYEVPQLETALKVCRLHGFHRISQPSAVPMYDGRRVVWVFSKHYGLFELLERSISGESSQ